MLSTSVILRNSEILKSLLSGKGTCGSFKINLVVDWENLSDDKKNCWNF